MSDKDDFNPLTGDSYDFVPERNPLTGDLYEVPGDSDMMKESRKGLSMDQAVKTSKSLNEYKAEGISLTSGTIADWDQQWLEAKDESQGIPSVFANAWYQTVMGVGVGGIIEGTGETIETLWNGVASGGTDFTSGIEKGGNTVLGSFLMDVGGSIREHANEAAPIYNSTGFSPGRVEWWLQGVPSYFEFASILIPVAGEAKAISMLGKIGKFGKLNKALKGLSKGIKASGDVNDLAKGSSLFAKALRSAYGIEEGALDVAKLAKHYDKGVKMFKGVHGGMRARNVEGYMEAKQVFDSTFAQLPNNMSDSEKNAIAGQAASDTFNYNQALALIDIPQYMSAFGGGTFSVLGKLFKGTSKGSKVAKKIADYGLQGISEGFEEGTQFIIGEEASYNALADYGLVDPKSNKHRYKEYLEDDDMWTGVIHGAMGGMLMNAVGDIKDTEKAKKVTRRFSRSADIAHASAEASKTRSEAIIKKQAEQAQDITTVDKLRDGKFDEHLVTLSNNRETQKANKEPQDGYLETAEESEQATARAVKVAEIFEKYEKDYGIEDAAAFTHLELLNEQAANYHTVTAEARSKHRTGFRRYNKASDKGQIIFDATVKAQALEKVIKSKEAEYKKNFEGNEGEASTELREAELETLEALRATLEETNLTLKEAKETEVPLTRADKRLLNPKSLADTATNTIEQEAITSEAASTLWGEADDNFKKKAEDRPKIVSDFKEAIANATTEEQLNGVLEQYSVNINEEGSLTPEVAEKIAAAKREVIVEERDKAEQKNKKNLDDKEGIEEATYYNSEEGKARLEKLRADIERNPENEITPEVMAELAAFANAAAGKTVNEEKKGAPLEEKEDIKKGKAVPKVSPNLNAIGLTYYYEYTTEPTTESGKSLETVLKKATELIGRTVRPSSRGYKGKASLRDLKEASEALTEEDYWNAHLPMALLSEEGKATGASFSIPASDKVTSTEDRKHVLAVRKAIVDHYIETGEYLEFEISKVGPGAINNKENDRLAENGGTEVVPKTKPTLIKEGFIPGTEVPDFYIPAHSEKNEFSTEGTKLKGSPDLTSSLTLTGEEKVIGATFLVTTRKDGTTGTVKLNNATYGEHSEALSALTDLISGLASGELRTKDMSDTSYINGISNIDAYRLLYEEGAVRGESKDRTYGRLNLKDKSFSFADGQLFRFSPKLSEEEREANKEALRKALEGKRFSINGSLVANANAKGAGIREYFEAKGPVTLFGKEVKANSKTNNYNYLLSDTGVVTSDIINPDKPYVKPGISISPVGQSTGTLTAEEQRAAYEAQVKAEEVAKEAAIVEEEVTPTVEEEIDEEIEAVPTKVEEATTVEIEEVEIEETPVTKGEVTVKVKPETTETKVEEPKVKVTKIKKKKKGRKFAQSALREDYVRGDVESELQWLNEVLPQIPTETHKELIAFKGESGKAFGIFADAMIILSDHLQEGTGYHEAFHAVSQLFLTPEQRATMYNEYRERTGETELTEDEVEEELAEGFRRYVLSKGKNFLKQQPVTQNFFQRIWELIRDAFKPHGSYIKEIYDGIQSGSFKDSIPLDSRMEALAKKTFAHQALNIDLPVKQGTDLVSSLFYEYTESLGGVMKEDGSVLSKIAIPESFITGTLNAFHAQGIEKLEGLNEELEEADEEDTVDILEQIEEAEYFNSIYTKAHASTADLLQAVLDKAGSYGLKAEELEAAAEEEKMDDELGEKIFSKNSTEYSALEGTTKSIKLLLSTIPHRNYEYFSEEAEDGSEVYTKEIVDELNSVGRQQMVPEVGIWSAIMNVTSDVVPFKLADDQIENGGEKILDALKNLEHTRPEMAEVLKRINQDKNINKPLINAFYRTFSKRKNNFKQVGSAKRFDEATKSKTIEGRISTASTKKHSDVLRDSWFTNLKDSLFAEGEFNHARVTSVVANFSVLQGDLKTKLKNKDYHNSETIDLIPDIIKVQDFLELLGVDVRIQTLEHYVFSETAKTNKAPNGSTNYAKTLKALVDKLAFSVVGGDNALKTLSSEAKNTAAKGEDFIFPEKKNALIRQEPIFKQLAELQTLVENPSSEDMVLGADGTMNYLYSEHNHLSKTIPEMKENPLWIERKKQSLYSRRSYYLKQLENARSREDWTKVKEDLEHTLILSVKNIHEMSSDTGTKVTKLKALDDVFTRLTGVLNQRKGDNQKSIAIPLTPADKGELFGFEGFKLLDTEYHAGTFSTEVHEVFYDYFQAGMDRIDHTLKQSAEGKVEVANYHTKGQALMHHIFPAASVPKIQGEKIVQAMNPALSKAIYVETAGEYSVVKSNQVSPIVTNFITETLKDLVQDEFKNLQEAGVFTLTDKGYVNNVLDAKIYSYYYNQVAARGQKGAPVSEKAVWEAVAADFALNTAIANIETTMLFTGDPAFYKPNKGDGASFFGADLTKRVPEIQAPGLDPNFLDPTFDVVFIKDFETEQTMMTPNGEMSTYDHYTETLIELGHTAEEVADWLGPYKETNVADAQGYITLNRWRDILLGLNNWSDSHQSLFERLSRGEGIYKEASEYLQAPADFTFSKGGIKTLAKELKDTFEDVENITMEPNSAVKNNNKITVHTAESSTEYTGVSDRALKEIVIKSNEYKADRVTGIEFLQPLKGQYYNTAMENGIEVPTYIKYSQMVLTPTINPEGTPLGDLRAKMEAKGVSEAIFESGVKVGVSNPIDYEDMLNSEKDYELKPRTLENRHWRLQQELASKYKKKGETTLGAQVANFIISELNPEGIYGDNDAAGYRDLVDTLHSALSNYGLQKVIKEFGLTVTPEGDIKMDPAQMKDALSKMFDSSNANKNILRSIERGAPLDAYPQFRKKIIQEMLSKITGETAKFKVTGGSFIQGASFGALGANAELLRNTDIIWAGQAPSLRLLAPRMVDGVVKPGQILLPHNAIKMIPGWESMSMRKLTEIVNKSPEILQVVGYRIPTQALASADALEVVGILPDYMGDTVIVYPEITSKTGSDFDIDKMFINIPAAVYNTTFALDENGRLTQSKKLELVTVKSVMQAEIVEDIKKVLETNKEKSFTELLTESEYFNVAEYSLEDLKRFNRETGRILMSPKEAEWLDEAQAASSTPTSSITYNKEQQTAIDAAVDFLNNGNPEEFFVVEGKAGTGKTTIAQEILNQAAPFGGVFTGAVSNKAVEVIEKKFVEANIDSDFGSIARLIGATENPVTGEFKVDPESYAFKNAPIHKAGTLVIDEASMITEQALELIMKHKRPGTKVLFLGDIGQLPPIRDKKTSTPEQQSALSPVFEGVNKASLVTRVRQGEGSAILPFADHFWDSSTQGEQNASPAPKEAYTNSEGLTFTSSVSAEGTKINKFIVDEFAKAVETGDTNHIKVVTYRNATVDSINNYIREKIFGKEAKTFEEGEIVMFQNNGKTKSSDGQDLVFNNAEEVSLKNVKEEGVKTYRALGISVDVRGQDASYEAEGEIDVEVFLPHPSEKDKVQGFINDMRNAVLAMPKYDQRDAWQQFFAVQSSIPMVKHAYAITSHKSQGSTYDIAIINEKDIKSVSATDSITKNRAIYTALTRPKHQAIVITDKVEGTPDVDVAAEYASIVEGKKGGTQETATVETTSEVKEGVPEVFKVIPELASIGTTEQYSEYLDSVFPESKVKDIVYHTTDAEFESFKNQEVQAIGGGKDEGIYFSKDPNYYTSEGRKVKAIVDLKDPTTLNHSDFISALDASGVKKEDFKGDGLITETPYESEVQQNRSNFYVENANYQLDYDESGESEDVYYSKNGKEITKEEFEEGLQQWEKEKEPTLEFIVAFDAAQTHVLGSKKDIQAFKDFVSKTNSTSEATEGPAKKDVTKTKGFKQALDNLLLQAYRDRLLSPDSFAQLIKSIDSDWLKKLANNLAKSKGLIPGSMGQLHFFSHKHQFDTKNQFAVGKEGIGAIANNTIHAIKGSRLAKTKPFHLEHILSENDPFVDFFQRFPYANNGIRIEGGTVQLNMAEEKSADNKYSILDILGGFLNAHLDIAKDPYISLLNINSVTLGPALSMIRMGVPISSIADFMTSPAIIEYINVANLYEGKTAAPLVVAGEKVPMLTEKALMDKVKENLKNLTDKPLLPNETAEGRSVQVAADLETFEHMQKVSRLLNKQIKSTKADSHGATGSFIDALLRERTRVSFAVSETSNFRENFYEGTSLATKHTNSISLAVKMLMGETFGSSNQFLNGLAPEISMLLGKESRPKELTEKHYKKLEDEFYSYMLSDFPLFSLKTQQGREFGNERDGFNSMFRASYTVEGKVTINNNTMAKRLQRIKAAVETDPALKHLQGNALLELLNPVHGNKSSATPFSFIEVKKGGVTSVEAENLIIEAWEELVRDSMTADFATDLAKYTFHTSGFQHGNNSLGNLIPDDLLGEDFTKFIAQKLKLTDGTVDIFGDFADKFFDSVKDDFAFITPDEENLVYYKGAGAVRNMGGVAKPIPTTSYKHPHLNFEIKNYGPFPFFYEGEGIAGPKKELSTEEAREQRFSNHEAETLEKAKEKAVRFSDVFGVDVVFDPELKTKGAVRTKDGRSVVYINPSKVAKDTVIHEFGHVYIEALGGLKNPRIAAAIEQLRDTKLWSEVEEKYPELSGEDLAYEVLSTAIGREGAEMYEQVKDPSAWEQFLEYIFNAIKKLFGHPRNLAKDLAGEIISGKPKEMTFTVEDGIREQRMESDYEYTKEVKAVYEDVAEKILKRLNQAHTLLRNSDTSTSSNLNTRIAGLTSELEQAKTSQGIINFVSESIEALGNATSLLNSVRHTKRVFEIKDPETGEKTSLPLEEKILKILAHLKKDATKAASNFTKREREKIETALSTITTDKELTEFLANREDIPLSMVNLDAKAIYDVTQFIETFDIIKSVQEQLQDDPTLLEDEVLPEVIEILNKLEAALIPLKSNHKAVANKYLTTRLAKASNKVKNRYELEAQLEYQKLTGSTAKDKSLNEFVNEYIADRREEIKDAQIAYTRQLLREAPGDISLLSAWALDGRNIDDNLVQLAVKLLEGADKTTRDTTIARQRKLTKLLSTMRGVDTAMINPAKAYAPYLELGSDGKLTGNLVTDYRYSELEKAMKDAKDAVDKNKDKITSEELLKVFRDKEFKYLIRDSYPTLINDLIVAKSPKDIKAILDTTLERTTKEQKPYTTTVYKEYKKHLVGKTKRELYKHKISEKGKVTFFNGPANSLVPHDKFKNPQFTNLSKEQAKNLTELINFIKEDDAAIPESARLTSNTKIQLPKVVKGFNEDMMYNSKGAVKRYMRDSLGMSKDETLHGQAVPDEVRESENIFNKVKNVIASQRGEEAHMIPIHFRNESITPEDMSFDLASILVANTYSSQNFQNKTNVKADLYLLREALSERQVVQKTANGVTKILKHLGGDKFTKKGETQNLMTAFDSVLDQRLHGIKEVDAGTIFGANANKLSKKLLGFTSNAFLGLNWGGGVANLIQGQIMNFLAASGESRYFTSKDLGEAWKLYFTDGIKGLKDMGAHSHELTTKLEMVRELYDVPQDYSAFTGNMLTDSRLLRGLSTSNVHVFNSTAEHSVSSVLGIAMLNNIKVMDANGNFLTAEGTTKNEKEALGLYSAYSLVDGKLTLDPRVKKTTENIGDTEFTAENELDIQLKIQSLSNKLNGNYSKDNKSKLETTILGQQAIFLRKWMIPGYLQRFRGGSNIHTKEQLYFKDYVDNDRMFHSEFSQNYEEGTYVSTARFFVNSYKSLKADSDKLKMKVISNEWGKLTPLERENIMMTAKELSFAIGGLILSYGLASIAKDMDDEEGVVTSKNAMYFAAYLAKRTHGELSFYSDPREWAKTVKSPFVAISAVNNLLNLAFEPIAAMQRKDGFYNNKGEVVFLTKLGKLVPVTRMMGQFTDKEWETSYNYLQRSSNL